jgi:hypothetical protein
MEILALALQTDSTRVGTFVLGHSISRVVFGFADSKIKANHHDLSHHRNDPAKIEQYQIVTTWFAKQAAYFLERLQSIDEGNGSLLDHSLVVFGSGMKDGNTHEPLNVPISLFGSASGKLKTNLHIECTEGFVLANLHLTLLKAFGIDQSDFNAKADQPIEELLA